MICCENRTLEVIAKTRDMKDFRKLGLQIGQTVYAQCKNCETIYQRLKIFDKLNLYTKYDGKLTAEQLKELAPRCTETIHKFIEMQYLEQRRKI